MKSQKEETPEKPDFEKLAKEYFPDPRDQGSAISLLERIWRDYVASKEVAVLEEVRNHFVDRLPVGDVKAWDLILFSKEFVQYLDDKINAMQRVEKGK